VLFGHTGSKNRLERPIFLLVCSLVWTLFQATPGSGQGPSLVNALIVAEQAGSGNSKLEDLAFEKTEFQDVREGYVTLNWQSNEIASEYRVADKTGDEMYRGEFTQAFISGLADGTHTFVVEALDGDGQVVARSRQVATVQVSHWPMWQAITSFVAGLVVFLVLIGVIVRGSLVAAERDNDQPGGTAGSPEMADSHDATGSQR